MIFFKTLTIRAWGERGQPFYYSRNKMISFIGRKMCGGETGKRQRAKLSRQAKRS